MLTNGIILAISNHGTLKPLGIQFRPFANIVRGNKYHKQNSIKHGSFEHLFQHKRAKSVHLARVRILSMAPKVVQRALFGLVLQDHAPFDTNQILFKHQQIVRSDMVILWLMVDLLGKFYAIIYNGNFQKLNDHIYLIKIMSNNISRPYPTQIDLATQPPRRVGQQWWPKDSNLGPQWHPPLVYNSHKLITQLIQKGRALKHSICEGHFQLVM